MFTRVRVLGPPLRRDGNGTVALFSENESYSLLSSLQKELVLLHLALLTRR